MQGNIPFEGHGRDRHQHVLSMVRGIELALETTHRFILVELGSCRTSSSTGFHRILVNERAHLSRNLARSLLLVGAWLKDPYISFGIAALVEIAAYIVVHLVLDRWGRKLPYCLFVIALSLVSLTVLPIQTLLPEKSHGRRPPNSNSVQLRRSSSFSSKCPHAHSEHFAQIFRVGFLCHHLYLCQ